MAKKGIKITWKNYAMIMGRINKFFQKDTVRYRGEYEDIIEDKEESVKNLRKYLAGEIAEFKPAYRKEMKKVYDPYIEGRCEIHPVHENAKTDKYISEAYRTKKMECILAITDKYRATVIPVYIGNEVFITGDKMVIRDNRTVEWIQTIKSEPMSTYKRMNKSLEYVFIHREITREEEGNRLKSCVYEHLNGCDVTWDMCGTEYFPESLSWESRSIHDDIFDSARKVIERIDYKKCIFEPINEQLEVGDSIYTAIGSIQLVINLPEIAKNGFLSKTVNDNLYFLSEGEPVYDICVLVNKVLEKEGYYDGDDADPLLDDMYDYVSDDMYDWD
mgnify:CR=1 FL=1